MSPDIFTVGAIVAFAVPHTFETSGSLPDAKGSVDDESDVMVQKAVVSGKEVSLRKVVLFDEYLTFEELSEPRFVCDRIEVEIEFPEVLDNLINCLPASKVEENL